MSEPTAPHASISTTQPQPALNGSVPPRRPVSAAPRQRELRTKITGMRAALVAGARGMVGAAGITRITQLRQVILRGRRKSDAG